VSKRIRSAIAKVAATHRALGHHFTMSIKAGCFRA
jgi:hypothetical protein